MPDGIYRSVDQAATWQKVWQGSFSVLTAGPKSSARYFVGETWAGLMSVMAFREGSTEYSNLTIQGTESGQVQAVAVDPLDDRIIYVGGFYYPGGEYRSALFKTSDGGWTWEDLGGPFRADAVKKIEIDPIDPNRILVLAPPSLYKSEDAGSTWVMISSDLNPSDFRINPEAPDEIYIAGSSGVWLSENGGGMWSLIGGRPNWPRRMGIEIVPSIKMVFVGTEGGGLYRYRLLPLYAVSIVAGPGGTTDPSPGVYQYEDGATMNVTAVPQTGYAFKDWSGDRPGTANPLAITVDADLLVRANFKLAAPTGFSVVRQEARSLLMVQYIDILSWTRIAGVPGVAGYRIYVMNGTTPTLLDEVGASVSAYWRRGVAKTGTYRYGLAAVGSDGVEGEITWLGTTNLTKSRGPLDKGLGATRKVAERIRRR